ncbi:MAG: hypothetical protein ACHQD9_05460 [Chitinophagales bacterium]
MNRVSIGFEFLIVIFISAFLLTLSSCTWDKTFLIGRGSDGIKDSVCYQHEIQPIITSNCAMSGCHDGQSGEAMDLTTYWSVMQIVKPGNPGNSSLLQVINGGGENSMPPSPYPPLTADQITLIQTWIQQGAGYNIDCSVATPCDTSSVTYAGTIQPIIQNNCLGCHSSTASGGGILLTTWGQVADQALNGHLVCSVYHDPACKAMPKGGGQLSSCDLTKISMWVGAGAPNN